MPNIQSIVTGNINIWTSSIEQKSSAGRGRNNKISLYGIQKLRELILELAVRGKLVPQDPHDEPASALLEKIEAEKAQLVKEKRIKKSKKFQDISKEEKPFEVPQGWEWVRIGDIGHDWGQKTPDYQFTYIDVGSINKELGFVFGPTVLQASEAPSRARKIVKKGTVIYSTVRPYLLNIAVIDQEFDPEPIASTAFAIIHPFEGVSASFIYRYLRAPSFINYVKSCQTGIAYPAVNDKQFFSGTMPIPPAKEQLRIVAKVDELMALCDQLEKQTEESIEAQQVLVTTLLATLTQSQDAEELSQNWARISDHFDALFTTNHSIDQLKQTILQLAVMGKLVPQDPNDEPASVLLDKIEAEKERLLKEGKIKKQPLLPEINKKEKPYTEPFGWEFVRLGNVVNRIGSGSTPRGGKSAYVDNGFPFLRSQNVWNHGLDLQDVAYISEETHNKMSNTVVLPGDVLLNITGGSLGRSTIYPEDIGEANVSQHVTIIRPTEDKTRSFLHLCILSPYVQKMVWGRQVGMAREGLSKKVLELFEIPLPPLAEQQRIVTKVDELMTLCDQLKERLSDAQSIQNNLATTIVEKAVA